MKTIYKIKQQIRKNIESLNMQLENERNIHTINWCTNRKSAYENTLDIIEYEVKHAV